MENQNRNVPSPLDFEFIEKKYGKETLFLVLTIAGTMALDNPTSEFEGVKQSAIYDACRNYMVERGYMSSSLMPFKHLVKGYVEDLIAGKVK